MILAETPSETGRFRQLLREACPNVDASWFVLPVHPGDRTTAAVAYRERVYCYELYHQIRKLEEVHHLGPDEQLRYCLSGEIDKVGLDAVIQGGKEKPDFVWHVPGMSEYNITVVEVKQAWKFDLGGVRKDLETLSTFVSAGDRAYREGLLLLYGGYAPEGLADSGTRDKLLAKVRRAAERKHNDGFLLDDQLGKIRVLSHAHAGGDLFDLGTLAAILSSAPTGEKSAQYSYDGSPLPMTDAELLPR